LILLGQLIFECYEYQENGVPVNETTLNLRYEEQIKIGKKRNLKAKVFHTCNDLVPANLLLENLDLSKVKNLGVQEVFLDKIVGSLGRANDFDLAFNPRRLSNEGRWQRVAEGMLDGKSLPEPVFYKLGEKFYIVDGNQRVSVANSLGESSIRAQVIEVDVSSLKEDHSCTRIGFQIREGEGDIFLTGE
jgi:hypothetical protein